MKFDLKFSCFFKLSHDFNVIKILIKSTYKNWKYICKYEIYAINLVSLDLFFRFQNLSKDGKSS